MDVEQLEKIANSTFERWVNLCRQEKHSLAKDEAQTLIGLCVETIGGQNEADSETKNAALELGILFRGLQDFNTVYELIKSSNYELDDAQIEKVWVLLWDCKDRVEFSKSHYANAVLNVLLEKIKLLEKQIDEYAGSAIYTSAEIDCSVICSVCRADYRSCDHVAGQIYNGHLCSRTPTDLRLVNVAAVGVPEDPRNRLWPWKTHEAERGDLVLENCLILRSFRLDDFLDK